MVSDSILYAGNQIKGVQFKMDNREAPDMEVNEDEFKDIVNNSKKIVVADFYAEWCMPCLMLAPIIEELAKDMPDVKFVKVNTEDHEELAMKYNISSIPCLIIIKEGKEAGRIIGSHSQDVIENKIKAFI